jgi:hypothetical protein
MINVTEKDKTILRKLGEQYAEIATLPIQQEKKLLWRKVNNREGSHIAVWINEIPWHEMDIGDELTLLAEDPYLRTVENRMRRQIYQWKHMPADMVLEPCVVCQKVIRNTGIGAKEEFGLRSMYSEDESVFSHHFEPDLKNDDDLWKIKDPIVTYDEKETEERAQALKHIFDGVLKVELRGEPGFWFALWDGLITWFGVQHGLELLFDDPDFVHKCASRMTDAYMSGLDQYVRLGLISSNNNNTRVGSGGFGYTGELPEPKETPFPLRDIWGSSAAQIFSSVSPAMHDEFSLQYEIKWMERFGLNYYGCCEPLHDKIGFLEKIPNLRKISFSPWADIGKAADKAGGKYVLSCKTSPAGFATDSFKLESMKADLEKVLETTKGCSVEILMKDISTLLGKPERLFEWERMAMRLVEKYR